MNRREFVASAAGLALAGPAIGASVSDAPLTMSGMLALVPVMAGGSGPHLFVLDTGATVTAIDGTLSSAIGLDRYLPRDAGMGGFEAELQVAGKTLAISPAMVSMKPISDALGVAAMGLLGSDFLSAFHVSVDFAAQRLTLGAPGQPKPPNAVALRFAGMPFLEAEARNGFVTRHGEFGVDTGLDTGIKFKDDKSLPGLVNATKPGTTLTMSGPKAVQTGVVEALKLGGLDVLNLGVSVSDDAPPRGAGLTYVGTIGAPAFRGRILTLDYRGGWCALSPVIL